tara:strand:- start:436 stop:555 length:120 start_codon:yes stop_codon:yes gene_type:complete
MLVSKAKENEYGLIFNAKATSMCFHTNINAVISAAENLD